MTSNLARYPLGAAVTLDELDADPHGPLAALREREPVSWGAAIRQGDLVIVSLTAANRDPATFPDPDRFDLARPNARSHVAFAQGPHACIGSHLARLETQAALDAALDGWPGMHLAAGATPPTGVVFRKPKSVPVRWGL